MAVTGEILAIFYQIDNFDFSLYLRNAIINPPSIEVAHIVQSDRKG